MSFNMQHSATRTERPNEVLLQDPPSCLHPVHAVGQCWFIYLRCGVDCC